MPRSEYSPEPSEADQTEKQTNLPRVDARIPLFENLRSFFTAHTEYAHIFVRALTETLRLIRKAKSNQPLTTEQRVALFGQIYPVLAKIQEEVEFNQLDIHLVNHDNSWLVEVKYITPEWVGNPELSASTPNFDLLTDGEFSFDISSPAEIERALKKLSDLSFWRAPSTETPTE